MHWWGRKAQQRVTAAGAEARRVGIGQPAALALHARKRTWLIAVRQEGAPKIPCEHEHAGTAHASPTDSAKKRTPSPARQCFPNLETKFEGDNVGQAQIERAGGAHLTRAVGPAMKK
jgi:hypothetical protein